MRNRIISFILIISMLTCMIPAAFAAEVDPYDASDALHTLGLFQGTGTNVNGKPEYELERQATRAEAVTMMVRLLGREKEATEGNWSIPFTDVAAWSRPYIGYAFANGLTKGTSSTTFEGDGIIDAAQYITLLLRALQYSDNNGDFQWDKPWILSDKIGLTTGEYPNNNDFTRGNIASLSYQALFCTGKTDGLKLLTRLYKSSKTGVTFSKIVDANLLEPAGMLKFPAPKNLSLKSEGGKTIISFDTKSCLPDYGDNWRQMYYIYVSVSPDGPYTEEGIYDTIYDLFEGLSRGPLGYEFEDGKTYYFKLQAVEWYDGINQPEFAGPLSDEYLVATYSQDAPSGVFNSVYRSIVDQTGAMTEALRNINLAINAYLDFPSLALSYATLSQSQFENVENQAKQTAQLCEKYNNLKEIHSLLVSAYSLMTTITDYPLTSSSCLNYLSTAAHKSLDIADYYSEIVDKLQLIKNSYGY